MKIKLFDCSKLKNKITTFFCKDFFVFVPFIFYFLTAAPGIGVGDTAISIENIQNFRFTTFVNHHNLTILFGKLFFFLPLDNIAYKANLTSVFLGGAAIVLFYFLIKKTFNSRLTAVITAAVLMVSHSMWWHSTTIECYALNAFFTAWALFLFTSLQQKYTLRKIGWIFFVAGLAFFNHIQMGFIFAAAGIFFLWQSCSKIVRCEWQSFGRLVRTCGIFFLLGFAPFLLVFLRDIYVSGFSEAFGAATGGDFRQFMFKGDLFPALKELGFLIFQSFPSPFLILILFGFWVFWRKWRFTKSALAILSMFLINTSFFLFYSTWDKFAFLLPSFVILLFWASFALDFFRRFVFSRGRFYQIIFFFTVIFSIIFPTYFYAQIERWAQNPDSIWYQSYNNSYTENTHNISEYLANPDKHDYRDFEDYAVLLAEKLPRNAIYIDDDSRNFYTIDYLQKNYNYRPDLDVRMVNSWGFKNWGLDKKAFYDLLEYAYQSDRPTFAISLGYPLSEFIYQPDRSRNFTFTRYQLDERRWIYKMLTVADENGLADFSNMAINLGDYASIDFCSEIPIYSRAIYLFDQDMLYIGDEWREGDHLFIEARATGGELVFLLNSEKSQKFNLDFGMTMAPDYGILKIFLNSQKLTEVDLYSPEIIIQKLSKSVELNEGINRLEFKIDSKSPISSDYKAGIDYLDFKKTD